MMKKTLARLLACALILTLALGGLSALAETYPTAWDLTELYADADAWQADYDRAMEMIGQYDAFRGTLNTAQGLYDYLNYAYLGELTRIQNKLYLYATLGSQLNPADPTSAQLSSKMDQMLSVEYQATAFVDPELYALSLEERQALLDDPLLASWAYGLRQYVDPDHQPLSEDAFAAVSALSPGLGRAFDIYSVLSTLNLPSPRITLPDGTEKELTDSLMGEILYYGDYDHDFQAHAVDVMLSQAAPFADTFAALLDENISQNWASTQLYDYDSCLEYALSASDVEPEIYDMLLSAAHDGAKYYQRYLSAHARALGLSELTQWDMFSLTSDYYPDFLSYDDAVDLVRESLSVLGDDYIAVYDQLVTSGHVDVYPSNTKVTGALTLTMGEEYLPYVLLNYYGDTVDAGSLAHEIGHAIYARYAIEGQNGNELYDAPTTFTDEVASITNELLFYTHMMDNAATDEEKLYCLETLIQNFSSTFFDQAMYAEFEEEMYQIVENGGALDARTLNELWRSLNETYDGGMIHAEDDVATYWGLVPHFYYNHYVYQYATAAAYAASLCQRILSGEEGASEDYKAFLALGSSQKPSELLARAGVDPLSEETYQAALSFYARLVDQYERLVDVKLSQSKDQPAA